MPDDVAAALAKRVLQDVDKPPVKGSHTFPFIVRNESPPPQGGQGNRSLSDIFRSQMGDVLEMEAARRGDRLVQKQIEAMEKTAEADSLKAQMELEKLKRGEGPGGPGGPIGQITQTLQAMTALDQFRGPNNQNDTLKMIMETQRQSSENAWKMMIEMEKQRADLLGQMGTLREQSVKSQMDGIVKALEVRMESLAKEADWGAKMREFQRMNEMMGRGPNDEVQARALKTLEMEVDLKKKMMDNEQKRWEEDKKSTNEILKTVIATLGAASAPVIAKLADKAMGAALGGPPQLPPQNQAPRGGPGQPTPPAPNAPRQIPGLMGADGAPPQKTYSFEKPADVMNFQIECGNCKNHFGASAGSDHYVCDKCGAIHRQVEK